MKLHVLLVLVLIAPFCRGEAGVQGLPLTSQTLRNPAPYIPPQCYTRTDGVDGAVHNPCYVCHTASRRPNYVNDADLQLAYDFAEPMLTNHWRNLFRDRRNAVAAISDEEIRAYLRQSNYFNAEGRIAPAARLSDLPADWDANGNGHWDGFVPDVWFNFDAEGFDRDPEGIPTGWRAFAYYPFPGTFWPTNGSIGDVLIRLGPAFQRDRAGNLDRSVYKTNLAIVESMIREEDVPIGPVDETALGGVDIDRDGRIGVARTVVYEWAPLEDRVMWYVGQAYDLQRAGQLHSAAGLYPEGTEFVHTVRYVDVDESGANRLAPRMKEIRYARKRFWVDYAKLAHKASAEVKEKHDFPNRLRAVRGDLESGVSNGQAWAYAGFIEDAAGALRPQTFEELVFCVGCHGGVGANRDGVFSFDRRLSSDAYRGGWYHWSQRGLEGTPEPLRRDGRPEYAFYLERNGAGDELRDNEEVRQRFFRPDGGLKADALARLHDDVSYLLFASPERALALNKAYRTIVSEQSFVEGRDARLQPARNVHDTVEQGQPTGVETSVLGF
ncbi:MAG: hypothetical protein R3E86_21160 [Pseudomonadales bacterium]